MNSIDSISNLLKNTAVFGAVFIVGFIGYQVFSKGKKLGSAITDSVKSSSDFLTGKSEEKTLGTALFDIINQETQTISQEGSIYPTWWDFDQAERTRQALRRLQPEESVSLNTISGVVQ